MIKHAALGVLLQHGVRLPPASVQLRAIFRLVQTILCPIRTQWWTATVLARGGRGCHSDVTTRSLGLGLIDIGAHCPNMARIAGLGWPAFRPHPARSSGSHIYSKMPVGMPFSWVYSYAALELF